MNNTELQFLTELHNLFIKYNVHIEEVNDFGLPEQGFMANYKSIYFNGPGIKIEDLATVSWHKDQVNVN